MIKNIEVRATSHPRPHTPETDLGFGRVFTDHMFAMEYTRDAGWHNPRIEPYGALAMDPAAGVFHYGQAMFEGAKAFRAADGRVLLFRPDRHCHRMSEGAKRLCMPAVDPGFMQYAITELIKRDRDWVPSSPGTSLYIRPTLIANEPFLGVRPAERYLFFVILSPVGAYYSEGLAPVKIWIEQHFVRAAQGGLGAVKAGANYAASLLAADEAKKRGYSQVLWLDAAEHKYLEEVGVMNLFVLIGDELITPALEGSILAGVTRDSVITLAREWGMKVSERRIAIDELLAAQKDGSLREVFGCGTASVISPVGELAWDGQRLQIHDGKIGPIAQKLFDTISQIQRGILPDRRGWVVDIG
jgi:branched-chain amino acid aminotransferase